jgi:hypothetical protein
MLELLSEIPHPWLVAAIVAGWFLLIFLVGELDR